MRFIAVIDTDDPAVFDGATAADWLASRRLQQMKTLAAFCYADFDAFYMDYTLQLGAWDPDLVAPIPDADRRWWLLP